MAECHLFSVILSSNNAIKNIKTSFQIFGLFRIYPEVIRLFGILIGCVNLQIVQFYLNLNEVVAPCVTHLDFLY